MRLPTSTIATFLLAALPTALSLTITSPSASQQINPGLPFTITWTTSPSDPSTITLLLIHSSSTAYPLANSIASSSGSYTVPAWWVLDWGNGFTLEAQANAGGEVLGSVADLSLAGGVGEITTDSTGGLDFVTTAPLATASQEPGAATTGSDGEGLVTILSGEGTGSGSAASATGTATGEGASETGLSATESTSTETESVSESSASTTESTAAAASETAGGAAGGLRVAAGGVLGAVVVALMA